MTGLVGLDVAHQYSDIGGKAYALSRMIQHGIPVPTGWVVPAKFFLSGDREHTAARLRVELEANLIPGKRYITRSSALGEDGEVHSFAGQLDSFPTDGAIDSVLDAIYRCLDSGQGDRATHYQTHTGQALRGVAVIVQEWITARRSGVLFTACPQNEAESSLEWVFGDCEKLVRGEVTPERRSLVRTIDVPRSDPDYALWSLARRIEGYFGSPQDLEWAIDDAGVWILQVRPITVSSRRTLWSNTNLNENYPEKMDPLLQSIARESYYHYFRNLMRATCGDQVVREAERDLRNSVGFWGERIYYNLTAIHSIFRRAPLSARLQKSFDDFVGHVDGEVSATSHSAVSPVGFLFRIAREYLILPRKIARFESRVEMFSVRAQAAHTFSELSREFYSFLELRFVAWIDASFADFFAMLFHGALGKLAGPELQNGLVQGIPGLISKEPIHAMWELNLEIRRNAELFEIFSGTAPIQLDTFPSVSYPSFRSALDRYLENWGFRCSGELLFESENFCERPETFLGLLRSYFQSGPEDPRIIFSREDDRYRQTLREAKRAQSSIGRLLALSFVTRAARYSIACRERARLKQALAYFRFKVVIQRLGAALVRDGILELASDAFYLSFKEIDLLLSEAGTVDRIPDLKEMLRARRTSHSATTKIYPDLFLSYGGRDPRIQACRSTPRDETDSALRGIPASRGTISGRAVVLKDVHEAHRLSPGDILITRQTDPGWICIFPIISGLVIERGGMLSHGAIVAREFGISAVVGVPDATVLIPDGSQITIDGDRGTVCVH